MTRCAAVAFACAVALTSASGSAAAQSGSADIFSRLEGRWTGDGQLMGQAATFEMSWERRGDGLAVLDFTNPFLHAVAVYRIAGGPAEATWLDSRPERITIEWEATGSMLIARWSSASESGRSEYELVSEDEAVVRDYVDGADGARLFGEARYRRSGGR